MSSLNRIQTVQDFLNSDRFRRLFKEGFWIVFGQALSVVGSLIGIRILTGIMAPSAFGELALAMTIATLIGQVIFGPLSNGVTRFYVPAAERGELNGYFKAVSSLTVRATGSVGLVALASLPVLILTRRATWIPVVFTALAFSLISGYNLILCGIQNAVRQRVIVALHQGLEPWARFFCAAILMVWFGGSNLVALAGYCLGIGFVLWSQFLFFRRTVASQSAGNGHDRAWRTNIWNYSWPFVSWGMFTWAQLSSDRWALGYFASTREVGYYAVLYLIGYYPISTATNMAVQFLAPIFYQRAGDASDNSRNANVIRLSWRLTGFALTLTAVCFLLTALLHSIIFKVFIGKQYGDISFLLPWMLLAGGIFASAQSIQLNLMSQMKIKLVIKAKIITAVMGVAMNYIGAYLAGIKGVVVASILFSLANFIWIALLSRKADKEVMGSMQSPLTTV